MNISQRSTRRLNNLLGRRPVDGGWFRVLSNTGAGAPTRVDIYDEIGGGSWFSDGVTAVDFVAQLAAIDGDLEVHINSPGGDVFDGLAIYNSLAQRPGKVTTVIDGLAASAASFIAQAGKTRIIAPGAMMMIHDASGLCVGNASDMRELAGLLDKVSDNIASIYAEATGRADGWRQAMQAETWYTADEAVAAGLAHKLAQRPAEAALAAAAHFDLSAYERVPERLAAAHSRTAAVPPRPVTADGSSGEAETATQDQGGVGRVLGVETTPIVDKAMPIHHTATEDSAWDGPAAVAAMPNDDAVLRYCHAWMSPEAAAETPREGDDDADDQKGSYKFPHHRTKGGPANVAACRNGLARLESADIPDADRAGVKAHLQAHLDDANDGTDNRARRPAWINQLKNRGGHKGRTAPAPAWLDNAEEAK